METVREAMSGAQEPAVNASVITESGESRPAMLPAMQSQTVPPVPQVFVVDDDLAVREWLEVLLKAAGHSVASFASAPAFLEAYGPSGSRPLDKAVENGTYCNKNNNFGCYCARSGQELLATDRGRCRALGRCGVTWLESKIAMQRE